MIHTTEEKLDKEMVLFRTIKGPQSQEGVVPAVCKGWREAEVKPALPPSLSLSSHLTTPPYSHC